MVNIIKVDILEEHLPFDVFCIGFTCTQSSQGVSSEELASQRGLRKQSLCLRVAKGRQHLEAS